MKQEKKQIRLLSKKTLFSQRRNLIAQNFVDF
jgi:hypothetical protein